MISAKDTYENAKVLHEILEDVFEKELTRSRAHLRSLEQDMWSQCSHTNKRYEDEFDYHKRENWIYCHCVDCGKYLGRK